MKLDGSEDHLISSRLKSLVWSEMVEFRKTLLNSPHATSIRAESKNDPARLSEKESQQSTGCTC